MSRSLRRSSSAKRISGACKPVVESVEGRVLLAAHIVGDPNVYPTIQSAVNAAAPGATINVDPGTYNESVTINKSLTLDGAQHGVDARTRSGAESIVDGSSLGGRTVFNVAASDVTIDGFTLQGSTNSNVFGPAVYLNPGTSGSHVVNDIIQNNYAGLFLANANAGDQTVVQFDLFQNNTAGLNTDIYADQYTAGAGGVNNVKIDSNSFTNSSFVEGAWALGISNTGTTPFTNITYSNNSVTNHGRGAYFYNTTDSVLSGNTFTGASHYDIGLFGGGNYGAPANSSFTISNNHLNVNGSGGAGVELVDDTPGSAYSGTLTVSGDQYTTSGTDLSIRNESTTPIDATGETFNGVAASSATTAQQYAIVHSIVDGVDVPGFGLVRTKAGNVYVTPNSFYSPDGTTTPSIQRGINAATVGDTVNVAAATYNEPTIVVSKSVTLLGAQANVDARTRGAVPESIVSNSEGDFQIEADNVTINGFTLEGVTANPSTDSASLGVAIWTNPGFSGTHGGTQVLDNIIQGNIAGIELDNDGTYQTKVQFNLIQNNNQPGAGGGNGIETNFGLINALVDNNSFKNNPNSAMVVPVTGSQGIVYSNNSTDSALAFFGVSNAQITGNTVANSTSGAFYMGGGDTHIAISQNIVSSVITGNAAVDIENPYSSYGVTPNSDITVTNNILNVHGGGGAGVKVSDGGTPGSAYSGTLTVAGDQYTTSGSDLSIVDKSTTPIDATAETFNGVAASSATLAQLNVMEGTIIDHHTNPAFGVVKLNSLLSAVGIVVLDPTGSNALQASGTGAQAIVTNGLIVVDSSNSQAVSVQGGAKLVVRELEVTGNVTKDNMSTITGVVKTGTAPVSDPLAGLPAPTTTGLTTQSTKQDVIPDNKSVTLSPGLYIGGIKTGHNDTITLNPGLYYLQGGGFNIGDHTSVTDGGSGVLIYNAWAGNGDQIQLNNGASLTVSAQTTGTYAGVAIFEARSSQNAPSLQVQGGSRLNVTGAVYAPSAMMNFHDSGTVVNITKPASNPPAALMVVKDLEDQNGAVLNVNVGAAVATTPTVTVTSGNEVYTGSGYVPATTVTGSSGVDSGAVVTYTYYVGTGTGGTNLGATAPVTVGTYTVVAHFAGDTLYTAANSSPKTFQITTATPTVTVTDAGGPFTGSPYPATATVTGVSGSPSSSLESVTPTLTYYSGTGTGGTNLGSTAPSAVGTYTVVANFAGSADYAAAASSPVTFTITPASTGQVAMLLLDPSGNNALQEGGGSTITASGESIVVDSSNSQAINVGGGGSLSAKEIDVTGNIHNGGTVSGTVKTGTTPVADPLAGLAAPSLSGITVRSTQQYQVPDNTTITLQPGEYIGGIKIGNKCNVTLAPGIYYIQGGGFQVGQSTVTGSGVLIYNAWQGGGDAININGGSVTLSAMTTGTYAGVTIFQARANYQNGQTTGAPQIQLGGTNAKLTITGAIYAASAMISIGGGDTLNITRTSGSSIPDIIASDLNDGGGSVILA